MIGDDKNTVSELETKKLGADGLYHKGPNQPILTVSLLNYVMLSLRVFLIKQSGHPPKQIQGPFEISTTIIPTNSLGQIWVRNIRTRRIFFQAW